MVDKSSIPQSNPQNGKRGPKSPHAKQSISTNAVRHGVTSRQLLRCRRDKCIYYELCPVSSFLTDLPIGMWCILEVCLYEHLISQYTTADLCNGATNTVVSELALIDIRLARCNRALAIQNDSNITRGGGAKAEGPPTLHPLYRYKNELQGTKLRILQQLHSKEKVL